jgi:mRNA interferase RelE/StbE
MFYTVGFKPAAIRQLRELDRDVQSMIIAAIESLADNLRLDGCKKLKGTADLYRIRVASVYRVVYEVWDRELVITVVKVGHRRDGYQK